MANYTLRVTKNGQTKTAVLRDNQNGRITAESNTDYQLYNEKGELITHPVTERVDDNLLVFADGNKDGSPEFVLVDYFNKNPILNADYVADAGNSLMTNDKLAAVVPVAESGAWVKAATVLAATAIGGAIWAVAKDDDNGNPDWRINNGIRNEPTADTTISTPSITINDVADIKKSAVADSYTISGSLNNVDSDATATVWVSLNGKDAKQATVNGNTWTLTVSGSELSATEGENAVSATVTATDTAGNVATGAQAATDNFTVTNDLLNEPTIKVYSIAPITTESGNTTVSGSLNLNNEDLTSEKVTVIVGDKTYDATIAADKKSWTADVPNADLVAANGKISAKVDIAKGDLTADALNTEQPIVTDATSPDNNVDTVTLDLPLNEPTITVHSIAPITTESGNTTVSGSLNLNNEDLTSEKVTVTVGDKTYDATIAADKKSWTVDVPNADLVAANGKISAKVDIAKGDKTADALNTEQPIVTDATNPNNNVDTVALDLPLNKPTITVHSIAPITSKDGTTTLSGSLNLNNEDLDSETVLVIFPTKSYMATIAADKKSWTVSNVPNSDLIAANGEIQARVNIAKDGKMANALNTEQPIVTDATSPNNNVDSFTIDLPLNEPTITVHSIAPITSKDGTTTISGSLNLNNEDLTSEKVTVTIGDKSYPAVISADKQSWTAQVPNSDLVQSTGEIEAKVEIAKDAKTADALSTEQEIVPDAANPNNNVKTFEIDKTINTPTITIKDVADIDQASVADKYTLSGSLNNIDADVTSTVVTVNVNGTDKTATVSNDKKSWTLEVSGSELANKVGTDLKVTATVKVTDAVGNTATSSANDTYNVTKTVTPLVEPTITVHAIEPITAANLSGKTTLSGSLNLNNDNLDSETVTVNVAGTDYTATISADKKSWTVADVANTNLAKVQGENAIVATVKIAKGDQTADALSTDTATSSDNVKTFTVDTAITTPTITIKDVADIDQASVADKYTLSGSLNNIDADVTSTVVTVNVNGTDKTATVSSDKKSWTLDVSGSELANKVGADLKVSATVKVTDAVDNTATSTAAEDTYNVTAKPVTPSITIDTIASDEVALMNKFFGTQNKTISGKLADIPTGATPKVEVTVAGKAYTATVSGSTWSIAVPKSELTERGAKNVVAKLTVNGASDEATATFYVIDPNITIDQQSIHITQDNLNGTTTLTGTYDVEGADTRKVLVQIGKGFTGSGLTTVAKEYSSDDTTNPVVLNEDNNTWSITVNNKDLAFQVGDVNTLQVGAKVVFTEGSQSGDKYTSFGYASDVVAPKASPLVLDLVDEEMPVTSYVLSKTTEVGGDDSVSGNDDVADTFVFSQVLDGSIATIANFDVNEDRVQLSSEVFTALSNTMSDFADYVQYDAATGVLSYDADGTGAGAAVPFAQLDKDLPIEQNHFIIG